MNQVTPQRAPRRAATSRRRLGALLAGGATLAAAGSLALAGTAGASGSGSGLGGLSNALKNASHATYQATYLIKNSSGNQTMVIAQSGKKSYFKASSGVVVSNGSKTYFCSDTGGSQSCVTASGGNPLAGLTALFSPSTIINELGTFQSELASHASGVSVKTSSATYGGQPSTCVTVTSSSNKSTWCAVTSKGVLSYESSAGNSITLKSFSTNVPSSLFALPSGASVVTIPSGVSIPNVPGT